MQTIHFLLGAITILVPALNAEPELVDIDEINWWITHDEVIHLSEEEHKEFERPCGEFCPWGSHGKRKMSRLSEDNYLSYNLDLLGLEQDEVCYDYRYEFQRKRRSIAIGGLWDDCFDFIAAAVTKIVEYVAPGCTQDGELDVFSASCAGEVALTLVPAAGPAIRAVRISGNIYVKVAKQLKGIPPGKAVKINKKDQKEIINKVKKEGKKEVKKETKEEKQIKEEEEFLEKRFKRLDGNKKIESRVNYLQLFETTRKMKFYHARRTTHDTRRGKERFEGMFKPPSGAVECPNHPSAYHYKKTWQQNEWVEAHVRINWDINDDDDEEKAVGERIQENTMFLLYTCKSCNSKNSKDNNTHAKKDCGGQPDGFFEVKEGTRVVFMPWP